MYKIKSALVLFTSLLVISNKTVAQAPSLPTKGILSKTVLGNISFNNNSTVDTIVKNWPIGNEYTLEVVAKVSSSIDRGLDIEARNGLLKGFRLTLDTTNLKRSDTLYKITSYRGGLAKGKYQTIRIAAKNDTANIYLNDKYVTSKAFSVIKDIVVSSYKETDSVNNAILGANLISNWDTGSGKPTANGWSNSYSNNFFANANATTSGTSRFLDITETAYPHTYNGKSFTGRVMLVRWDGGTPSFQNAVYSFPVSLVANTLYNFSWLYSSYNGGKTPFNITVGIGTTANILDRFSQKTFATDTTAKSLRYSDFSFITPSTSGTYYITITSTNSIVFSISKLSISTLTPTPRFIFGKYYNTGAVNMDILSATYEEGAYAPDASLPLKIVEFTGLSTKKGNLLQWKTSNETNINYFVLERSIYPSNDYTPLATFATKSISSQVNEYSFNDENILCGKYVYRLKQVDKIGEYSFSNTVILQAQAAMSSLKVFPNPVYNSATFVLPTNDDRGDVEVLNMSGKIVVQQIGKKVEDGRLQLELKTLSKGLYLVNFRSNLTKKLYVISFEKL